MIRHDYSRVNLSDFYYDDKCELICPLEIMIKYFLALALRKLRLKLNSNVEFLPLALFNLTV